MGKVKVLSSLTMGDRGRWSITTTDNEFSIDFRTGAVEERDPNGYLVPLLEDAALTLERIDWLQLGRKGKLWISDLNDRPSGTRYSLETTGQVLSIVSDRVGRAVLKRQRLDLEALGDAYTAEAMCGLLGIGSRQLRSMVTDVEVLEVTGARGERGYPMFQVGTDGSLLPGLCDVLCELADGVDDPWTWWIWLMSRPRWANGDAMWELLRDDGRRGVVSAAGRAAWTWRR